MSVVGIDFGATNAVIAAAGRGGVDVILNGNSNRLNPYVLCCFVPFYRLILQRLHPPKRSPWNRSGGPWRSDGQTP